jgi:hypothetical protein
MEHSLRPAGQGEELCASGTARVNPGGALRLESGWQPSAAADSPAVDRDYPL